MQLETFERALGLKKVAQIGEKWRKKERWMQRYFKKTKRDSGMFHLQCLSAFLIITSFLPLTSDIIHSSPTVEEVLAN